ncbi:hypothetical protein ACIPJ1_09465 [Microbacterium maritypicum]|uniref:hypothetical protein n=1 Tax=Microbacterium maritypicum TaxID=33918 RepID=UPI00380D8FDC
MRSDLLKVRAGIRERRAIASDAELFSRAMLELLYEAGAFTPDQCNGAAGGKDYDFLLKMFIKHNMDDITRLQRIASQSCSMEKSSRSFSRIRAWVDRAFTSRAQAHAKSTATRCLNWVGAESPDLG